ncbi:MAG: LPS assembly lipoprotein LptE [Formivibrio sp.]|nr:LPS assembly lipoprotein LptE [Formivibrio sp.]
MQANMRILITLLLGLVLTACGFHLRGGGESGGLAFTQVKVEGEGVAAKNLRDYLANYKGVEQVKDGPSETVIRVLSEQYTKDVYTLNNSGRVAEYRLNYRLNFSATYKGEPVLEDATVTASRTLSWNENNILSKESEEATLVKDMQRDVLQLILRRVSASVSKAKQ